MNTPVSFILAKLLKEKEFVGSCHWYYDSYRKEYVECLPHTGINLSGDIETPTIAEVVMWLYEKHGIWIDISFDSWNKNNFSWSIQRKKDASFHYDNTDEYPTPTEAYESAIEYTLNNLI